MTQPRQQHSNQRSGIARSASRWEKRHVSVEQLWSGHSNDWLLELTTNWSPGTALEISCGEGADVLWLAECSWQVAGLDLSATTIRCLIGQAERLGVASHVTGRIHDAGNGLPVGPFDLVTGSYVRGGHELGSLDLVVLLPDAASCVALGRHLLTTVHVVNLPWHVRHARTYTVTEFLEGLAEATTGREVVVGEERDR